MSNTGGRAALFVLSLLIFGVVAGLGGYYAGGRSDAIDDARPLTRLADRLLAHGKGGRGLGVGREALLLAVLDPASANDPERPSAGVPALTQTLAERLAPGHFDAGLGRIRQAGYASGLATRLSRTRLIALWLETVEMGRGPHGWLRGVYDASRALYGRKPEQLTDDEFIHLLAIATGPKTPPNGDDRAVDARIARIRSLLAAPCEHAADRDAAPHACETI